MRKKGVRAVSGPRDRDRDEDRDAREEAEAIVYGADDDLSDIAGSAHEGDEEAYAVETITDAG